MNQYDERRLKDLIDNIRGNTFRAYKDWFDDIKAANPESIDLGPLYEFQQSLSSLVKAYMEQMYYTYDKKVSQYEMLSDPEYRGLAQEYAEKAVRERETLVNEALALVTPFLNTETDSPNKYGFDKAISEKILAGIPSRQMEGMSIFAAKTMFVPNKKEYSPKLMRAYYRMEHIKDEILSIRKKYLLECLKDLDFEGAYNLICERMINGSAPQES
ncbi:MAG: hypothetical protein K2N48_10540 [Muribaculaceae bacterium]|nr:hypothetical protein [Muribaculaceae bacterium]